MLRTLATLAITAAALFAAPTAAHAGTVPLHAGPDFGGCRIPSFRACPGPTDPTPPRWFNIHREPICHRPVVCFVTTRVQVER